tara:strand:+ start:3450 stop:3965 length:516 start_codon:yes stop_codon:yes gene_type:complete
MKYFVEMVGGTHEVELVERLGELIVKVDGEPMNFDYHEIDLLGQVVATHDGQSYALSVEGGKSKVRVTLAGHTYAMELEDERERAAHLAERAARGGGGPIKAVMPGIVVEYLVEVGAEVAEGQPLLILEAMKMQNEISAPGPGILAAIHVEAGATVAAGDKLVTLKGLETE